MNNDLSDDMLDRIYVASWEAEGREAALRKVCNHVIEVCRAECLRKFAHENQLFYYHEYNDAAKACAAALAKLQKGRRG